MTSQPDLQATVIFKDVSTDDFPRLPLPHNDDGSLSKSRIAPGSDSISSSTTRFRETTRQLLRNRLIIAALVFLISMLIANAVFLFLGELISSTAFSRTVAAIALAMALYILRRHPEMTLRSLRTLELLIILVPVAELLYVLWTRTEHLAELGLPDRVPALRSQIAAVASLVITVYGIFIPNTWKRTAIVAFSIIGMTGLAMALQQHFNPSLHGTDAGDVDIHVIMAMLMIFFATIATLGSHVVHGIRRQIEKLREYGQYQLVSEIGRGSMGIVYKAEHRLLKRPAAIKLINADSATDRAAIARFEDEVQISATLSHWNTVQIYDYGQTDHGDFYYVMEYLQGEPLSARLKRLGPLSIEQTLHIMTQLCDGLEEAHAIGMIHRDLKPANIFLATVGGQHDVVKILDFGLATLTENTNTNTGNTIVGNANIACGVCGTPSYMSPEQIRGEPLDGRSDIYALGCILYECLTATQAFPGQSVSQILMNHLDGQLPNPSTLPPQETHLWPIIEHCLTQDKTTRYESVQALKAALTSI